MIKRLQHIKAHILLSSLKASVISRTKKAQLSAVRDTYLKWNRYVFWAQFSSSRKTVKNKSNSIGIGSLTFISGIFRFLIVKVISNETYKNCQQIWRIRIIYKLNVYVYEFLKSTTHCLNPFCFAKRKPIYEEQGLI